MDSPFDVLGVGSDADDAVVEQAYRQRVKEAHPDHGGSASEFQLVRAAYKELAEDSVEDHADTEDERRKSTVEYLNYGVLDDHGWTLNDENLFEKAGAVGLDAADYGTFSVRPYESLLEAAETHECAWPFACRGGACANCAVAVIEGAMEMPVNHVLPAELLDRDIRLSCNGIPATEKLKVVYNVKHLPGLEELRLPPRSFERTPL
ncbi:MAG TPA: ferredoxin Fer [Halococcus sp.]|nr:ferredoxin Fer [Halococcus sp.]